MSRLSSILLIAWLVLSLAACGSLGCCEGCGEEGFALSDATLGETPNVHLFGDVYTAGQPSAEDMRLAAAAGVATVINIRSAGESDLDEAGLCAELGMDYHNPGWRSPAELTDERFAELRQLLETAPRPILFHCGSANRVGAHWLTWRVLDGGLSVEEASAEAEAVGLRSPPLKAMALDYIARQQAGQ